MELDDGRVLKGHLGAFSLDGRLTAGASFVFNGSSSDGLLSRWSSQQVGPIANGPSALLFDDPETGLQARLLVTQLPYELALEWRLEFTNPTDHALPLLESIRSLDISLEVGDGHRPLLRSLNGSACAASDFLPIELEIHDGQPIRLEPVGGRSSDTTMPFFCIVIGDRQYAFAIGWSGQWLAELNLDAGTLRVRAGLADAALTLRPSESIRAPSVLMLGNTSSQPDATSRLRTVLGDHYAPTSVDGGPVTPVAHMTMATFHSTGITSEAAELAAVEQGSRLGLEAHWIDACWYGDSSNWYEQVGNWAVRKEIFPRGLRPIADAAHQAGMKFVFWMEPERARVDSALARSHPEFFLAIPGDEDNLLLDLGRADAREYVLNLISGYISEFAVDIYRQDFNIAPLVAWRNADEPARAGVTEIRYIEGLYALWDALLERHPGLVIDNCASGGRRIDLETTRRAVPLWRSDFVDFNGGAEAVGISITNQMQTSGLHRWIPQHTGPIWSFDAYDTRSALSTGVVIYCELPHDPRQRSLAAAAVAEYKRLRTAQRGEFHLLQPATATPEGWHAFQFHRADTDSGFAVFFRRSSETAARETFGLQGLHSARYEVTYSTDYDRGPVAVRTCSELQHVSITLSEAPSSTLIEYARLDN